MHSEPASCRLRWAISDHWRATSRMYGITNVAGAVKHLQADELQSQLHA
jgi:hypothetical protein